MALTTLQTSVAKALADHNHDNAELDNEIADAFEAEDGASFDRAAFLAECDGYDGSDLDDFDDDDLYDDDFDEDSIFDDDFDDFDDDDLDFDDDLDED